jgi:hypothetical protein
VGQSTAAGRDTRASLGWRSAPLRWSRSFTAAAYGRAAGLFGFGAVVMLIGDNFIQPAFIGGTTRLPFLLILVGIVGGLQTFGETSRPTMNIKKNDAELGQKSRFIARSDELQTVRPATKPANK